MERDWQLISEGLQKLDTLNNWEKGFVESVLVQLAKGYTLSMRQTETIQNIQAKNDPKNIERKAGWEADWDDDKRKIAEICAHYYLNAGYFTRLANAVLEDKTYVPSEKQFKAMCENKYAQKVLAATFGEPIYPIGSMVSFRASAPWQVRSVHKSGAVVLKAGGGVVTSAAKGAKVYEILPIGAVKPVKLEERHLKKFRQPKKK
jgi:hypothetical protein